MFRYLVFVLFFNSTIPILVYVHNKVYYIMYVLYTCTVLLY